jgi:serine/threonine protein kinase
VSPSETAAPITQVDDLVPFRHGDVIAGKYRMDRVLGVGGMGIVLAGTHTTLGQRVAIKFMLPTALKHEGLAARFEREARAVVRLRSEHVARVFDVGEDRGLPFMVMELLEGQDLGDQLVAEGPLPVANAVDYVLQACDAIREAHAAGIIHRDLKPRNLFLSRRADGRALVKVLDFGISKVGSAEDMSLTRTTEVMGSPNYMSPEQLRSARAVDERTDIWALGAILFELLTGRVPFEAESVTELCSKVLQDPTPSVCALRSDVPVALDRIIARCLEKQRENRYAKVDELARALTALREGSSSAFDATVSANSIVSGPLLPAERSRRKLIVGVIAAAGLLGGLGAWVWFGSARSTLSVSSAPLAPTAPTITSQPTTAPSPPTPPTTPQLAAPTEPAASVAPPVVTPAPPAPSTAKKPPKPSPAPAPSPDDLPASRR